LNKKIKKKMQEDFRKREEAKICPCIISGNPEISKLCHYKDIKNRNTKKCRSNAHRGCAKYKELKEKGLI
jgi:hypothetical protein